MSGQLVQLGESASAPLDVVTGWRSERATVAIATALFEFGPRGNAV